MQAVLVEKESGRLVIGDWEEPGVGGNDILIRGEATAINRADLLQKSGKYPPPPGESTILGLEIAGVVEAVGSTVTRWQVGDRVCALLPGGGYAAKARVPSGQVMAVPQGLSFEQAAAIPEVFLTAWFFVGIFSEERSMPESRMALPYPFPAGSLEIARHIRQCD